MYGSWEEWHERVEKQDRKVDFNVYNGDGDELKTWMDIHMGYLSQFGPIHDDPVPLRELVQDEVNR